MLNFLTELSLSQISLYMNDIRTNYSTKNGKGVCLFPKKQKGWRLEVSFSSFFSIKGHDFKTNLRSWGNNKQWAIEMVSKNMWFLFFGCVCVCMRACAHWERGSQIMTYDTKMKSSWQGTEFTSWGLSRICFLGDDNIRKRDFKWNLGKQGTMTSLHYKMLLFQFTGMK